MIGLYQKAIELLNKEIESRADTFNFDESSGISKEDQRVAPEVASAKDPCTANWSKSNVLM